jgi:hypothetical protein
MIRATISNYTANKVNLTIHQGTIVIRGPVADLIRRDFNVGESLFVLLGRGQETLERDASE